MDSDDQGMTIQEIIAKVKAYNPASDSERLRVAYEFSAACHGDQRRDSGEPYICHPLSVADILASLQIDDTTIVAGLLHDVVEDTSVTPAQVEEKFGPDARKLVEGVTKLSKLEFRNRHEAQAENLRRMFMAMSADIRIILIKLADRLHNMRTIETHRSELRKKEIAEETLSIYAPLAHRLGIFKLKSELEDRSIAVLEPEAVSAIKMSLAEEKDERDRFINEHIARIEEALKGVGIKAEVNGRIKNYYSIFNKMQRQHKELSEIFDLNAIRIIVDTARECYETLGIIHTMWKPIPGRFKDYIAMPKQNMYQSIHTTLIADSGVPFEVQIRTWDMHRISEFGIAAHWRYKEGRSADADFDKKIEWLRQMMEWQQEVGGDAREFMETVKGDLFNDNIYVFSPVGDVYELPAGSVPLDFAYRVHTQVGHQCVGAKVNHRLVPLETPLNNGDIVEIMTAKGRGPSRDWLNICRTQQAKNKIRQWFRKEKREENIAAGAEALDRELKKLNLDPPTALKDEKLLEIARRFNCASLEELYAGIGDGAVRAETAAGKYRDEVKKDQPPQVEIRPERQNISPEGVVVEGLSDPMVRLAACCKPLPGEDILGYVTRGRGISVHRADCSNAQRYQETEPERIIAVGWGQQTGGFYQVEMEAICLDRERLLMDIMAVMAETKTAVNGVHVTVDKKTRICSVFIKMEVKSLEQFEYLMQRVGRIKDVQEVRRMLHQRHRRGEQ